MLLLEISNSFLVFHCISTKLFSDFQSFLIYYYIYQKYFNFYNHCLYTVINGSRCQQRSSGGLSTVIYSRKGVIYGHLQSLTVIPVIWGPPRSSTVTWGPSTAIYGQVWSCVGNLRPLGVIYNHLRSSEGI